MSTTTDQPTTNVSQLPARDTTMRLKDCRTLTQAFQTHELMRLIEDTRPKHIEAKTMLRAFVQATARNPLILKCDLRQSLGAFMSLAYLGLVPGTILNQARLIPFKRGKSGDKYDLQVIIGYPGLVDLAYRSGFVRSIHTGVYLPGDDWRQVNGTTNELVHTRNLDIDQSNATPKAVYAVAEIAGEGTVPEVMTWGEVLAIRNRSQAYIRARRAKADADKKQERPPLTWTEAPWVRDEREMGRKTVLRRIAKVLPKTPELRAGVAIEDAQDAGKRMDWGPVIDGEITPFDGIPVQDGGDDYDDSDAGGAFADRRTDTTQQSSPEADPKTPMSTSATSNEAAKSDIPFEAVIVDQWGEVSDPYFDRVGFARALVEIALSVEADRFVDFLASNADAIEDAETDPEAKRLLAAVAAPEDDELYDAVAVPMKGDKQDWAGWLKELRATLASLRPEQSFPRWVEFQHERVHHAPVAQRALAANAIVSEFVRQKIDPPTWITELRKSRKPDAVDTGPALDMRSDDEKTADGYIAQIAEFDRAKFDAWVRDKDVRAMMAQWRVANTKLFNRVNAAANTRDEQLKKAQG